MSTYKIISFDKTFGSIVVQYDPNEAPFSVDIPFTNNGEYLTGNELDTYIQGFIPTWHIERKNKIASGIPNESAIEELVQPIPTTVPVVNEIELTQTAQAFLDIETEKTIAKALVKFGVLQSDPTIIQTTTV